MLAQSSAEFRDFISNNPVALRQFDKIDSGDARGIRRGLSRMLAWQYLGRLRDIYFPCMTFADQLGALTAYRRDAEYMKALLQFYLSETKRQFYLFFRFVQTKRNHFRNKWR